MNPSSVLIDTHILVWMLFEPEKLRKVPDVKTLEKFILSPITLLEIRFLVESKKIPIDFSTFVERLHTDERFTLDDVSFSELCETAFEIPWTRDPFDRLLVAHSQLRSLPLATCDRLILQNYARVMK